MARCPVCKREVKVSVDYEEDEVFGATISIEIVCAFCNDTRCTSVDGAPEIIENLLQKIGS